MTALNQFSLSVTKGLYALRYNRISEEYCGANPTVKSVRNGLHLKQHRSRDAAPRITENQEPQAGMSK